MGIIAAMQPPHAVEDKPWAEARLGPERTRGAYAWRTLRRAGARVVFGSDLAGSDHSLFYGLHAAMTRRDKDQQPSGGWYPGERFSPEESVRAYSTWAAYAAFREQDGGPIALVQDGDRISIDVDACALTVDLTDAELAARRAVWTPPAAKATTGVLAKYVRLVGSASEGCVTD
jgi:hypothetical protein